MDLPVDLQTSSAAFSPPVAQYELPGRRGTSTDEVPALAARAFRKSISDSLATVIEMACDDAVSEHFKAQVEKHLGQRQLRVETAARIRDLQIDAVLSGEAFSEDSLEDLMTFLNGLTPRERPSLFLLDSGNLRAFWRNESGEQVGLQFMGQELVQYVMFARRPKSQKILRHYGQDLLGEIRSKITLNGCDHLIN